jgi:IclR family acetate operon transcriptional repressor
VLVGEQVQLTSLVEHCLEDESADIVLQEPVPVLGKSALVEGGILDVEVQEPLEEEVVLEALAELALAANRVEGHQETGLELVLGRDRGPALLGIHLVKDRAQLRERRLYKRLHAPNGVVGCDELISGDREEGHLAGGAAAHAASWKTWAVTEREMSCWQFAISRCRARARGYFISLLVAEPADSPFDSRKPVTVTLVSMRALERLVSILEAVAESRSPVTPSAVASRVALSLSTISRLMRQLSDEGLLSRAATDGSYSLGPRLLSLALTTIQPLDLVEAAVPEMQALRDLTGETVSLHVHRGDSRVCIAQVQGLHPIRRVVPVGFNVPLHFGATGEILLAALPPEALDDYLSRVGLSRHKQQSLMERLEQNRRDGWAIAVDAWTEGLSAVAAPIHEGDEVVASLAVSGPTARWSASIMRSFAADVATAAERISATIRSGSAIAEPAGGRSGLSL